MSGCLPSRLAAGFAPAAITAVAPAIQLAMPAPTWFEAFGVSAAYAYDDTTTSTTPSAIDLSLETPTT